MRRWNARYLATPSGETIREQLHSTVPHPERPKRRQLKTLQPSCNESKVRISGIAAQRNGHCCIVNLTQTQRANETEKTLGLWRSRARRDRRHRRAGRVRIAGRETKRQ